MNNNKCKACGKEFHYCTNCGYDEELHPLSEGYCCKECLIEDDGETYPMTEIKIDELKEQLNDANELIQLAYLVAHEAINNGVRTVEIGTGVTNIYPLREKFDRYIIEHDLEDFEATYKYE